MNRFLCFVAVFVVGVLCFSGCMFWTLPMDGGDSEVSVPDGAVCVPGQRIVNDPRCLPMACEAGGWYSECSPAGDGIVCHCGTACVCSPGVWVADDCNISVCRAGTTGHQCNIDCLGYGSCRDLPGQTCVPPASDGGTDVPVTDTGFPDTFVADSGPIPDTGTHADVPVDSTCSPGVWTPDNCNSAVCGLGTTGHRCNDLGTGYDPCSLLPGRTCLGDAGVDVPPSDTGTCICVPGTWVVNDCNAGVCGLGNSGVPCGSDCHSFGPCATLPGHLCPPPVDSGVDTGVIVDTGSDTGTVVTDTGFDTGTTVVDTGVDVPTDSGINCVPGVWWPNDCNALVCGIGTTGRRCNDAGNGYGPCDTLPAHVCGADAGTDAPPPDAVICTPGVWSPNNCNAAVCGLGNTGQQCNVSGTGYGPCDLIPSRICVPPVTDSGVDAGVDVGTDSGVTCTPGVYVIDNCNASVCGLGNTGRQCNSSGTGYDPCVQLPAHPCVPPGDSGTDAGFDTGTDAGTCLCVPGVWWPNDCNALVCSAGNTGRQCNSDCMTYGSCTMLPGRSCIPPVDSGVDTGVDAGTDTGFDTGTASDTGTEAATGDTGTATDTGSTMDAATDTGFDTGTDMGSDITVVICTPNAWLFNDCNGAVCGSGNTGQQCNSSGTAWGACVLIPGRICVPPDSGVDACTCVVGAWSVTNCNLSCGAGNSGQQCSSDCHTLGACGVLPGHTCDGITTCVPNAWSVTNCNSSSCGLGNTGQQCNSSGTAYGPCSVLPGHTCGGGTTCVPNAWTINNCNAGSCGYGNTGQQCNSSGTALGPCSVVPGHSCGGSCTCTAGVWIANDCNSIGCGIGNTGVQCSSDCRSYGACQLLPGRTCVPGGSGSRQIAAQLNTWATYDGCSGGWILHAWGPSSRGTPHYLASPGTRLVVTDTAGWTGWVVFHAQCSSNTSLWRNWGARGQVVSTFFSEFSLGGVSHLNDVTCPDIYSTPYTEVKPEMNMDMVYPAYTCPDGRRY